MYDEQELITRIVNATGYTVTFSEEINLELMSEDIRLPLVQVGHVGVKLHSNNPEDAWANLFREYDNDQLLITSVAFICTRASLTTVRTNIYNACKGFTPSAYAAGKDYSSLNFLQSSVIAKTGKRIWWEDLYGFAFPRLS